MNFKKIFLFLLCLMLPFHFQPVRADEKAPLLNLPGQLAIELPLSLPDNSMVLVPFIASAEIYGKLFSSDDYLYTFLQLHLYDAQNDYLAERIVDLKSVPGDWHLSLSRDEEGNIHRENYKRSEGDFFTTFQEPQDLQDRHLIGVLIPSGTLKSSHRNLSKLNFTYRLFRSDETLEKNYGNLEIRWHTGANNDLDTNGEIERYIQAGSLTCEFAAAKGALAMIGIIVDERNDLISKFDQANAADVYKNPTDYFLGDYGFGKKVPQSIHTRTSPLGGYGLHIDTPYLEKIVKPYAPFSELHSFSFEELDRALEQKWPVIVQGLQISYDHAILGGEVMKADPSDNRGMVTGEHAYVVFGKNENGDYRVKDPLKTRFQTIPRSAIEKSVRAFEQFGAKGNMILVKNQRSEPLKRSVYFQEESGKVVFQDL